MDRQHQEPNQHRNRFELPAEVPAEGAFVQRLPRNPRRSATPPPSPSPRDRRDRPVIEDLTKIVLPLLFALHFAITSGIVLNYTLSLNRALPRKYTIGAVITFGVLILLEIVGVTVLYFQRKCDRKRYGVAQRNHRVARDVEGGGGSRSGSRVRGGRGKGKGPELVRGGVIAGNRWWQRAWEWLKECYQQKLCFHCGFGLDKLTASQVNGAVDGPAASAEISPRVLEQGEQHSNEALSAPPQPAVDPTIVDGADLEQEHEMLQDQTCGIRQKNRLTEYHPRPRGSAVAITKRSLSERRQRHILSPPAKSKSLNGQHPSRNRVMNSYVQYPRAPGGMSLAAKLFQEDMEIKLAKFRKGLMMPDVDGLPADLTSQKLYKGRKLRRVGTIELNGGSKHRLDSHQRHGQGIMDEEMSDVNSLTGEDTSDLGVVELPMTLASSTLSQRSSVILPHVGQGLVVGREQIDDPEDRSSLQQQQESAGINESQKSTTLNRSETISTLHSHIHELDGVEIHSNNAESISSTSQNSMLQKRADSPTLGRSLNISLTSSDVQALSLWTCDKPWLRTLSQVERLLVDQEVSIDGPQIEEMDVWEDSKQDSDEWEDVEPVYEFEAPVEGQDDTTFEKSSVEEEASGLVLLPSKKYEFPCLQQKEKKHEDTEVCLDAELVTLFDAAEKYMEAGCRDSVINILPLK